jgi:hypothetical protein
VEFKIGEFVRFGFQDHQSGNIVPGFVMVTIADMCVEAIHKIFGLSDVALSIGEFENVDP